MVLYESEPNQVTLGMYLKIREELHQLLCDKGGDPDMQSMHNALMLEMQEVNATILACGVADVIIADEEILAAYAQFVERNARLRTEIWG